MGSDVSFAKLLIAKFAKVAELADALDLGSSGSRRGGSSPPFRIEQLTGSTFSPAPTCRRTPPPPPNAHKLNVLQHISFIMRRHLICAVRGANLLIARRCTLV